MVASAARPVAVAKVLSVVAVVPRLRAVLNVVLVARPKVMSDLEVKLREPTPLASTVTFAVTPVFTVDALTLLATCSKVSVL
ncbi:hypothetical protein D3C73_1134490 [compost metagenome]